MSDRLVREAGAVALLLAAVLMVVALASHSPLDPSPFHLSSEREQPHNLAGWLGATVSALLFDVIGLGALLLPVAAGLLGWRRLRGRPLARPRVVAAGWGLILVAVPGVIGLVCTQIEFRQGLVSCAGLLGRAEGELLGALAGPVGRVVILCLLLLIGGLMVSGISAGAAVDSTLAGLRGRRARRRGQQALQRREREREKGRQRVLERQLSGLGGGAAGGGSVTVKELEGRGRFRIVRRTAGEAAPEGVARPAKPSRSRRRKAQPAPVGEEPILQEEFDFVEELAEYDLPKFSFLDPPEEAGVRDTAALIEIGKLVAEKCHEFRVGGEVVNIRTGPVITTYEFRLEKGIKIATIQNLSEDLALALGTESVRIERIPGRNTVGIEVPNADQQQISLRQLLDTSEFRRSASLLTLALGVDIHGTPFFSDLQRMPHLLMGGFTGSGKSVGINAMIMSILYKATPEQVKFIMVDPKMVELGVYEDIPHLLTPIVKDAKKAANALGWAVAEMESRYRRLAALGVRNLEQYNQVVGDPARMKRLAERVEENGQDPEELEREPIIVIVIDELADLMLSSKRAVEESITRLAQKARAVGIHLICATQRPSVDILTGIIKANFPCRLAYKVRSKFDSRTILDVMGAEHLLGRGDMLFLPQGTSILKRLHGPMVETREIATVVRYAKRFGKPEYKRQVLSHPPVSGPDKGEGHDPSGEGGGLTDPMFEQAARLVVSTRKASASYIQRRLRLGYSRAARLVDMMEEEGIVGPLDGSKREVLVPPDYYEEVDATRDPDGLGD